MTIRFLRYSEIKKLKLFINNHYKKNHILSINNKVIKFFYNYRRQQKLNILGIFEKEKLKAILGFIPLNNWDKNLKKDIFLALMFKSKKYKKDIIGMMKKLKTLELILTLILQLKIINIIQLRLSRWLKILILINLLLYL